MPKSIFIILIILGFVLPISAHAALVPCGRCCQEWSEDRTECINPCPGVGHWEAQPCTLCDIFRMLQIVVNYIWWFLLVIAPLFIIAGGIMILTAGVKPDQLESGKRIITGTVVGLAIAFLSWMILNMVFLTIAKQPGQEGFPWPWNEIRCTGGEIKEQQEYEETVLRAEDRYCHAQITNAPDRMVREYSTVQLCYENCEGLCSGINGCERWCCLSLNRDGANNVCGGWTSDPGWCKRPAPVSSLNWILNPPPGGADLNQRGDASIQLINFLDCMYLRIPELRINSISDNRLCTDPPTCDPATGNGCIHTRGSCHYGGTNCLGFSYAVDFHTNIRCSVIRDNALACNPSAWFNWEDNHAHVSVNNTYCGCNEALTGIMCPD